MPSIVGVRSIGVLSAALALFGYGQPACAQTPDRMVVRPVENLKFEARPDGSSLAILSGDPATGPSEVLLKFKRGSIPMHWHPSGYYAVVLQGTVKHWAEGEQEATSPLLRPGSYWFQPPRLVHTDSCVDASGECMIFAHNFGKWGLTASGPAKK